MRSLTTPSADRWMLRSEPPCAWGTGISEVYGWMPLPVFSSSYPFSSSDIRQDGHHACFSVIGIMAMRKPLAWVVGIEIDLDGLTWQDDDGVFPWSGCVRLDNLERVAVHVHRVVHRRVVAYPQS